METFAVHCETHFGLRAIFCNWIDQSKLPASCTTSSSLLLLPNNSTGTDRPGLLSNEIVGKEMTRLGTSETITTAAQYSNIHSEKASVITNTATSGNKSANGTINKLIELTYEYCVQYVVCLDSLSSSLSLRRCLSIHSDKLESCRLWVFVLCN